MVDGNQERHFFCAFLWGNKALQLLMRTAPRTRFQGFDTTSGDVSLIHCSVEGLEKWKPGTQDENTKQSLLRQTEDSCHCLWCCNYFESFRLRETLSSSSSPSAQSNVHIVHIVIQREYVPSKRFKMCLFLH